MRNSICGFHQLFFHLLSNICYEWHQVLHDKEVAYDRLPCSARTFRQRQSAHVSYFSFSFKLPSQQKLSIFLAIVVIRCYSRMTVLQCLAFTWTSVPAGTGCMAGSSLFFLAIIKVGQTYLVGGLKLGIAVTSFSVSSTGINLLRIGEIQSRIRCRQF